MISWSYVQAGAPSSPLTDAQIAALPGPVRVVFVGGHVKVLTGGDAIVDKLHCRFRFFFKEWFLNQKLGFPWREYVLIKNADRNVVASYVRETIETCPGVTSIDFIDLSTRPALRILDVSFAARMRDGIQLTYQEEPFDLTRRRAA